MKSLLAPAETQPSHRCIRWAIPVLLVLSATALSLAPLLMPDSYSWLSNFISESAAQGVRGAWLARLGFLTFGFAVVWLAIVRRSRWARGAYWSHLAFGVLMISTAAFSHRPWLAQAPFDAFEDFLHSVTATGMGFAFALGVLFRLLQRSERTVRAMLFDCCAIVASVALPLSGEVWPAVAGLAQRLLFVIAYVWYAREAQCDRKAPENRRDLTL